jgi:hypothetical protein
MSSRLPCKHKRTERRPVRFTHRPPVMGPAPICRQCAREAGADLVEMMRKAKERRDAMPLSLSDLGDLGWWDGEP